MIKKLKKILNRLQSLKLINLLILLSLLSVAVGVALFLKQKPQQIAAAWFNDNWLYRKAVEVTNSSGSNLTDFQVSISIGTSAPIAAGKMKSDCSDIRITDVNGKLLPHWIEESNPGCNAVTDTKVWVKVPSIPTSGGTVYVYYGNPSATNVGDGNKVFEFFDNFSDNDISDWTTASGTWSVNSGSLESSSTSHPLIYHTNYNSTDYITESRFRITSSVSGDQQAWLVSRLSDSTHFYAYGYRGASGTNHYQLYEINPGWAQLADSTSDTVSQNTWYKFKFQVAGSSLKSKSWTAGNSEPGSWQIDTSDSSLSSGMVGFSGTWVAATLQFDDIFIRKYASTEPSSSLSSTEEQSPGPLVYWKFDEGVGSTANDSGQNRYPGTITGSVWKQEEFCVSGKCLFNGETADNRVQSSASVTIPNAYTLSIWLKGERTKQIAENIYCLGWTSKISLALQGNTQSPWTGVLIRNAADDNQWGVLTYTNILDNQWHHLAATVDRSTLEVKVYIDGILRKTATIADHYSGSTQLLAGGWSTTYGNFTGFMDETKIYPYVRTADQIKADYNAGKSGPASSEGSSVVLSAADDTGKSLNNGLVGYWKMDENTGVALTDYSGIGSTGTLGAGDSAPSWSTGMYGVGLSFDGSNDYATISNESNFDFERSNPFSISLWVKHASGNNVIVSKLDDAGNTGYELWATAGNVYFYLFNVWSTNAIYVYGANATDYSNWHHVVATYDGSSKAAGVKIYVNGDSRALTTTFDNLSASTLNNIALSLGSRNGKNLFLNGSLDEVRIYNRALSPKEVRDLYNWAPGPIGYWNFNEKTGTTAYDTSENSNNASFGTGSYVPTWAVGKFGGAVQFDGNDHLSITDHPTLAYKQGFTASAWVHPTSWSSSHNTIVGQETGFLLAVDGSGNLANWIHAGGSWTKDTSSNPAIPLNAWVHLTVVYDGAKIKSYVNGVLQGTGTTKTGDMNDSSSIIGIGKRDTGTYQPFAGGKIDDVRIYNYARTQKQIVEDMNAGHPAVGSPVGSQLHYWKADQGYGATANDSGTGGKNISLSSTSWINDGKIGKALSFDGTNSFGTVSNFAINSNFSTSLWVNRQGDGSDVNGREVLLRAGPPNGVDFRSRAGYGDTRTQFTIYGTSTNRTIYGPVLTNNTWYHLVIVFDDPNDTVRLYLNGVLYTSSSSYTDTVSQSGTTLYVGGISATTTGHLFNGYLDEIKIYNGVLTEDEIKLDYNQGKALVMGALSSGTGNTAPQNAASQEYCVPGDTTSCASPIAEWTFNEGIGGTVNDNSGNGYVGNWSGTGSEHWLPGKIGKAGNFNGSDDYVSASKGALTPYAGTVSMWLMNNQNWDTFSTIQTPFCTDQDGNGDLLDLAVTNWSYIEFLYWDGWGATGRTASPTIWPTANTWHYLAVTWNGSHGANSNAQIYLDGQALTMSANSVINTDAIGSNINIGGNCAIGDREPWAGKIDQVRIYNYARTPAQIAWDYNRGSPIGEWKLDECQGTTAYDSSVFATNSTISIGTSVPQTTAGSCGVGNTAAAWYNGVSGKYSSGINLDGTDDYLTKTNPTMYNFNGLSFSVETWVYPKVLSTTVDKHQYLITKAYYPGDSTSRGWHLGISRYTDQFEFRVLNSSGTTQNVYSNDDMAINNWHHVVGVYNSDTQKLNIYINGVKQNDEESSAVLADATSANLNFGAYSQTNGNLNGILDSIRIYNYPLNATQVKSLYNENSSVRFGPNETN